MDIVTVKYLIYGIVAFMVLLGLIIFVYEVKNAPIYPDDYGT